MTLRAYRAKTAALISAILVLGLGATNASAADDVESKDSTSDEVVIDGRTFGPEDGLEIVTETIKVVPGQGTVGNYYNDPTPEIGARAVWGTSYATSTESLLVLFTGKARAGGNVYAGKRIIQVCIWYTQGNLKRTDTVCASASSSGGWGAGSEKRVTLFDNLSDNWPQTELNIRTTRIDPGVPA